MMLDFKKKLKKVLDFFAPANLAEQKIKYEGDVALLVIDVQEEFCDPKGGRGNAETAEVSKRIQSIVPEFRKAGVPVYAVYFSYREKKNADEIDFYEFTPHPDDTLVAKDADSAFRGSDIKKILEKDGRKRLLTCGFNLNACVRSTVVDALTEGFEVSLLRDLTGNDNENIRAETQAYLDEMARGGAAIEQSGKVLDLIRSKKNAADLSNKCGT